MRAELSADAFAALLTYLDANPEHAGEKYEELRLVLNRFFEWRHAPFPEEHTDDVLDRLAKKISAGVDVRNVRAYSYEIARLVLLESLKTNEHRRESLDEPDASGLLIEAEAKEMHLACLDDCLENLNESNRQLIIDYYRDERRDRIAQRQRIARRLGLSREALANRAQRLRDKLEKCVSRCVGKKTAI